MSAELTHEQAADEIEAVALGIAAEEVSQGVTAHAARCPECAAELRSFYQVVTSLSTLIPARQLNRGHSAGIKSRLLAKVSAGQEGAPARRPPRTEPARAPESRSPLRVPESRAQARSPELRAPAPRPALIEDEPGRDRKDRSTGPIFIGIVATVLVLGSIAALLNSRGDGDSLAAGGSDETRSTDSRVTELEGALAAKDTMIASLTGPGVRIISLFNREARAPLGRMFWDRRSDRWMLFVYSLRQPGPGKTFRVWLGTDTGRVSLGTFQPASDGTATFRAEHPLAIGALNTVSISEEDVGSGGSAPTGPVVLAGALR